MKNTLQEFYSLVLAMSFHINESALNASINKTAPSSVLKCCVNADNNCIKRKAIQLSYIVQNSSYLKGQRLSAVATPSTAVNVDRGEIRLNLRPVHFYTLAK